MKVKTRKLIAAITATTLLFGAVGVGSFAINNSNNDFGFKGSYSLNAFAEEESKAQATTINVGVVSVDATTTLTLPSSDSKYTLFVTVIDVDDFECLTNVVVGYTVDEKNYNGIETDLTNVVYSSLTIKNGDEEDTTSTVYASELAEKYETITTPKLIIAEVESSDITAEVCINGTVFGQSATFSDAASSNSFFIATGSKKNGTSLVYKGATLTNGLKLDSGGILDIDQSLTIDTSLTLGFVNSAGNKISVYEYDGTTETAVKTKDEEGNDVDLVYTIPSTNVLTIDLPANTSGNKYRFRRTSSECVLFYAELYMQHDTHNFTLSKITKTPTDTEIGLAELVCSRGGEIKTVELPVISDESYILGTPVVTNDGHDISTPYTCTIDGVDISFDVETNDHSYAATPVSVDGWKWSKDSDGNWAAKANVTYQCSVCSFNNTEEKTAIVNNNGDGTYTGTITINGVDYTDVWDPNSTVDDKLTITDTNTSGHILTTNESINYTSDLGYFSIDSNNTKFKYASVTALGGNQIVANSDGAELRIICNESASSIVVTIKLGIGSSSGYTAKSSATVTYPNGTTSTIGDNIIDEYEFTLKKGEVISIKAVNRIALLSVSAVVTPA